MIKIVSLILVSIFVLAAETLRADSLSLPANDLIAPEVVHAPILQVTNFAKNGLTIAATVTDNVRIKNVRLFYRTIGSKDYKSVLMQLGSNNNYSYIFSAQDLTAPGVEYYIQAKDMAGNTLLHGYSFSPLITQIDSTGSNDSVAKISSSEAINNNASSASGEPLWKNKWLWAGIGLLTAAVISNSGDEEDASTNKPTGDTITSAPPSTGQ